MKGGLKNVRLEFSKIHPEAKLPTYGSQEAACFDFYACKRTIISHREVTVVPTGLTVKIPAGHMLEVRPRSGLASKGVFLANAPGTIDRDYAGEIGVLLVTLALHYTIEAGDRIAQGRLVPATQIILKEIPTGWEENYSERGAGGFGSTGK